MVPQSLYLADGRAVPVCVVRVERTEPDTATLPPRRWPRSRLGGGFPALTSVQGQSHLATFGALVTDGHTAYALTSRHVSGPTGSPVASMLRGVEMTVGRSAGRQLTRVPFSQVYPQFPTQQRTLVTLDAGLVEIDTVQDWTSRTYGLARTGALVDLNELTMTLQLIDTEVEAFGAASGNLHGRIAALCYRYQSIGGFDQVTDFLIAPDTDVRSRPASGRTSRSPAEQATVMSRPGDSGTVWHLVPPAGGLLRPVALEWGGQAFLNSGGQAWNFTLAASLTSVLRLLEVDLVTAHNVGAQPFWGKTGHYTIASYACANVLTPRWPTTPTGSASPSTI
jgi:hypothetical protein